MTLQEDAQEKLEELQFEIDHIEYSITTDTAKLQRLKERKKKLEESLGYPTVMDSFGKVEESVEKLKELLNKND